ncbi:MAG: hypothetical protein F4039_06970 [Gammaproteobacteria bacterium]|nr:hypothetical protein [Gammaproteobacteria bacterium]
MPSPADIKRELEAQKPMLKEQTEKEIPTWDTDNDGELNIDEFKEMIDSQAKDMAEKREQSPTPQPDIPGVWGKSVLASEDKTKVEDYERALNAVFEDYDEDENDTLSVAELVEYGIDQTLVMMGLEDTEGEEENNSEE